MTGLGVALLLLFAAENTLEVKVSVPPAGIATPILMLQGLEIGANEGFSIRVLGPAVAGGERPVFGVAAIEGERQAAPKEPRQKMDLAIPLNARAREALHKLADGWGQSVYNVYLARPDVDKLARPVLRQAPAAR